MLTRITVRNFKRFDEVEVELGNPVVFIGPNNSGKTSAMQALALWDLGLKRWNEKRAGKSAPGKRPGVTVNRRDLFAIPHPSAVQLWRDLHVRDVTKIDGKQHTSNVRIELVVEGVNEDKAWQCGLEFDYANEESFYCRPLRLDEGRPPRRMPIPHQAGSVRVAFLPPMSGLAATETRLDEGALNVRIGEGRTAEVLRNLCFRIVEKNPDQWNSLVERMESLFGVALDKPRYVEQRGEITMGYRERGSVALDLSSSGRGLQQTLLILACMYANPGAVILLDEPAAHLEILRQRQIYNLITEVARASGNQIIAASHSEVLLNEAADKDLVIAFVGSPHRIEDEKSQVRKALAEIGFDQYYQAEQTGWVLYLEGATDLAILRAFARRLGKDAACRALERLFVHYVGNQPAAAARHFHGLREASRHLKGIALFDHLESGISDNPSFRQLMWKRREIENYLCTQATLETYARASAATAEPLPLFAPAEADRRLSTMREAIREISEALHSLDKGSPWDADFKVSDEFLKPLFRSYFSKLGIPNLMNKKNFYELADCVPESEIDPEISEKLDAIAAVAERAAECPEEHSGDFDDKDGRRAAKRETDTSKASSDERCRFIAIDWSGAKDRGGANGICLAEVRNNKLVRLEPGRSRRQVIDHIIECASDDSSLVVGLDFAFGFPRWFVDKNKARSIAEVWQLVQDHGEEWLQHCPCPFWGRPDTSKPQHTELFRVTEQQVKKRFNVSPKSVFQIGGAGQVGTGSIRGMPYLPELRDNGFSIWPFDTVSSRMVIEIYPRILKASLGIPTGSANTSSPEELRQQERRQLLDSLDEIDTDFAVEAERSADAFDAAVSAVQMSRNIGDFASSFTPTNDPYRLVEGEIWCPPLAGCALEEQ